jgi:hypothetical protein
MMIEGGVDMDLFVKSLIGEIIHDIHGKFDKLIIEEKWL